MLRHHESSNSGEESSDSQTNGQHIARENSEQDTSCLSTSTPQPPDRYDNPNEPPEGDDRRRLPDPYSVADPSAAPDPSSSPGTLSSPDPSSAPNPPPAPESYPRRHEITHDTNICLKILLDSEDKGHFLELQTSVKVCQVM